MTTGIVLDGRHRGGAPAHACDDGHATEHLPERSRVAGFLESPEGVRTAAWAKAVETPWTKTIRPDVQDRLRIVGKPCQRPACDGNDTSEGVCA